MPIYEFKCEDCGQVIEKLSPLVLTENIIICDCGGVARKMVSRISFPNSKKAWMGRGEVNFDVDTPQEEIKKQLAAASGAGHFDYGPARKERIRIGSEAIKSAPDVRGIE